MASQEVNKFAELAAKYVNNTDRNIFLTGKAGTGKTTFLKNLMSLTYKNTIVVAPTGIAAINAGGTTIHSQFQLPFGAFVPDVNYSASLSSQSIFNNPTSLFQNLQMTAPKRKLLREMELLVIDEVSMLRADVLDAIDTVLRSIRGKRDLAFGGVQVLFIGDLLQLPPVVKNHEWGILSKYYASIFFFNALVLKKNPPLYIELEKIYRQSDQEFIDVLNNLRHNVLLDSDKGILNQYVNPNFDPRPEENYIFLTTHNRKADEINQRELDRLTGKKTSYKADVAKDFPDSMQPVNPQLILKEGAQVMFIKNDYSGKQRYFNGKIGTVTSLKKGSINVNFNDGEPDVEVEKYVWENKRYALNEKSGEIEEKLKGSFTQYPLRLAWAITVHKSQGLTFEKAIIDLENVFAPGQIYVALSRLTSLQGLVLTHSLNPPSLSNDQSVEKFMETKASYEGLSQHLSQNTITFLARKAQEAFDFDPVVYELKKFIASFNKESNRSKKQQDAVWANEILNNTEPLQRVGLSFMHEIHTITQEEAKGIGPRLLQRSTAAKGYFEPLLSKIEKTIFDKLKSLKGQEGVKAYIKELKDLGVTFSLRLKKLERLIRLLQAIIENKEFKREIPTSKKGTKQGEKVPTAKITLDLYQSGKSIIEIAKERGLGATTIEGHIAKNVGEGLLKADAFMEQADIEKIQAKAKALDTTNLTPIKEALAQEDYSYFQIKIAMAVV